MDIEAPMPSQDRAVEALHAQGITTPGPVLLGLVRDAIARQAEGLPGGERRYRFDYAELLADTPELIDRTKGPLKNPGTDVSYVVADVLTKVIRYLDED